MNAKLRVAALAALALPLLLAGCVKAGATPLAGASSAASPSPSTVVKPAAGGPAYVDVTQGDSSTAAILYSFDPTAHSAVIEPSIYMEGPTYCKKYRIRASDARCERETVLVQSHQRAAVPVSPRVKLFTSFSDEKDCVGSIEQGGSCPMTVPEFVKLFNADKVDFLVHVTIADGTVTRIAQEYAP